MCSTHITQISTFQIREGAQEYIYDDGKGSFFILTPLFSNVIQPPWTEDPTALGIFRAYSTKTDGDLETGCRCKFLPCPNKSSLFYLQRYKSLFLSMQILRRSNELWLKFLLISNPAAFRELQGALWYLQSTHRKIDGLNQAFFWVLGMDHVACITLFYHPSSLNPVMYREVTFLVESAIQNSL